MGKKQRIEELERCVEELEAKVAQLEVRPTRYRYSQYPPIPQYPNPWHPEVPQKPIEWYCMPSDHSIAS